jgi:hypothetical protein
MHSHDHPSVKHSPDTRPRPAPATPAARLISSLKQTCENAATARGHRGGGPKANYSGGAPRREPW